MKCLLPFTTLLIVAVLMQAEGWGEDPDVPPPEMKALERLVGTWDVEQENKVPEQDRLNYVLKAKAILGGRFIQQMGASHDEAKPTQMGMYTYDVNKKGSSDSRMRSPDQRRIEPRLIREEAPVLCRGVPVPLLWLPLFP